MLRELLSNHPQIELTLEEMQLLPRLMRKLGRSPDFSSAHILNAIDSLVQRSNFLFNMRRHGIDFDSPQFRSRVLSHETLQWQVVIETLIRQFLPPSCRNSTDMIVGEKTPTNLMHLELIGEYLPHSRFIHIVRDPRDTCLSMNQAWGKSFYRGAVRWRRYLEHYQRVVALPHLATRCLQVRYEDLLTDPSADLNRICDFLEVTFDPQMLSLRRPAEKIGAAAGADTIQHSNAAKFEAQLSTADTQTIEAITWTFMKRCGYEPQHACGEQPVSAIKYACLGANDLFAGVRHQMRDKGILAGIRYRLWQLYSC